MKVIALCAFAVCLLALCAMPVGARDCPSACPFIYQPTCGYNGRCYKQFSNGCEMAAAACNGQGSFKQASLRECKLHAC